MYMISDLIRYARIVTIKYSVAQVVECLGYFQSNYLVVTITLICQVYLTKIDLNNSSIHIPTYLLIIYLYLI